MPKFMRWLAGVAVLSVLLAGCGQKGDLYFPDRDAQRKTG